MAAEDGPIILSVDLDFLPVYAAERKVDEVAAATELARALRQKAGRPLDFVMSYSVNDGYTPILLRWLGDFFLKTIEDAGQAGGLEESDI
jgi:hypothetical protein